MGTNYYLFEHGQQPRDDHDGVHLGKSNAGARFLHHAYPEPDDVKGDLVCWPIVCYADWLNLILRGDIYDEYGTRVPWSKLVALVDSRQGMRGHYGPGIYRDATGADFMPGDFS